jgi:hypothetical protein
MKKIKITFDNAIPSSFWEAEEVRRMAPTAISENGCLIRFPDRMAPIAAKAIAQWLNERGYREYSVEEVH